MGSYLKTRVCCVVTVPAMKETLVPFPLIPLPHALTLEKLEAAVGGVGRTVKEMEEG